MREYFCDKWINREVGLNFIFLQGKCRNIIFLHHKHAQVKGFLRVIFDVNYGHWDVEFKCFLAIAFVLKIKKKFTHIFTRTQTRAIFRTKLPIRIIPLRARNSHFSIELGPAL